MILPGWDSVAATSAYAKLFTYAGWIALFSLGLFEIFAHVYSEHEKTLSSVAAEQTLSSEREARKKLEARVAPRFLTPEQGLLLSERLGQSKVKLVALYVYGSAPEIVRLSSQIGDALKRAGWNFEGWSVTGIATVAGVVVDVRNSAGLDTVGAANLLVRSLNEVGIDSGTGAPFSKENEEPGALFGPLWKPGKYAIRIHIGAKP